MDDAVKMIAALLVLLIIVLVFAAAWTWLTRYERAMKDLADMKRKLRRATEDATEWREVAEQLARTIEGRTE